MQLSSRRAGTRTFLCLKGSAESVCPGRNEPACISLGKAHPCASRSTGVLRWGSQSEAGSNLVIQQDPQDCSCLDSLLVLFCLFVNSAVVYFSNSESKDFPQHQKSLKRSLIPSAVITLGSDSAVSSILAGELTTQSEQPFQLYNPEIGKEKNVWAHVSLCSAQVIYLSVCQNPFKLQSCSCHGDTVVLKSGMTRVLISWDPGDHLNCGDKGQKEDYVHVWCCVQKPSLWTRKGIKMLGSLLLPCHHTQVKAELSLVFLPEILSEAMEGSH